MELQGARTQLIISLLLLLLNKHSTSPTAPRVEWIYIYLYNRLLISLKCNREKCATTPPTPSAILANLLYIYVFFIGMEWVGRGEGAMKGKNGCCARRRVMLLIIGDT